MIELLAPFRGERYRAAERLSALVAPPYDVISPEEREDYLARSPYNVVHLTLPDDEEQAGRDLQEWRRDGVLVRDAEPSYWLLSQDYVGPDGVQRTRSGLVASLRAEPYEHGAVLPHERTHRGPKEGRLRLLRATQTQLEPIFLLYDGDASELPARDPEVESGGDKLWRVKEAPSFESVELVIADGHHRYETARVHHQEGGAGHVLMCLVALQDPGLTVFPTHRLLTGLDGPRRESLRTTIQRDFDIAAEVGFHELAATPLTVKQLLLLDLAPPVTVFRRLNRLCALGIIERTRSPRDGRVHELRLAPAIHRLFAMYSQPDESSEQQPAGR